MQKSINFFLILLYNVLETANNIYKLKLKIDTKTQKMKKNKKSVDKW